METVEGGGRMKKGERG